MAKYLDESGVSTLWGKVKDLVSTSVGGVTQFDYEIVTVLPDVKDAVKGKYYLIANNESGNNQYDEYLLVGNTFEKVGPKEIDISGKQDNLTADQLNAVNSGITSDKVSTYDGYATGKQNALSQAQISAVDSGITSTKVSGYDTHISDANIHVTSSEKTTWNGKQDALTDAQVSAVDSGITSTKVSTYDGYATGKQNALSTSQISACDSGITAAKVSTYDGYATGKQDALNADQLNATNSGITSDKVSTYDGYASQISGKQDSMSSITEAELNTICV